MENPFEEKKIIRPAFLTVICILTFIGSGWAILSNLFSLFTSHLMNGTIRMEQYSDMMGDFENGEVASFMGNLLNSSMEVLQATAAHAHEIAVMGLVLSLVSLLGAVLMFRLKRAGFYFYTTAQVLSLFILPYFAGFSFLVVAGMLWSAFISLVFIIMYALNLRYMK